MGSKNAHQMVLYFDTVPKIFSTGKSKNIRIKLEIG